MREIKLHNIDSFHIPEVMSKQYALQSLRNSKVELHMIHFKTTKDIPQHVTGVCGTCDGLQTFLYIEDERLYIASTGEYRPKSQQEYLFEAELHRLSELNRRLSSHDVPLFANIGTAKITDTGLKTFSLIESSICETQNINYKFTQCTHYRITQFTKEPNLLKTLHECKHFSATSMTANLVISGIYYRHTESDVFKSCLEIYHVGNSLLLSKDLNLSNSLYNPYRIPIIKEVTHL